MINYVSTTEHLFISKIPVCFVILLACEHAFLFLPYITDFCSLSDTVWDNSSYLERTMYLRCNPTFLFVLHISLQLTSFSKFFHAFFCVVAISYFSEYKMQSFYLLFTLSLPFCCRPLPCDSMTCLN